MNATPSTPEQRPDAVVWVDERHAIVAHRDPGGQISTVEIRRVQQPEGRYLAHVVHELAGNEHVMVIGPQPIRLELERRFVAMCHHPERLMAVPAASRAGGESVVTGFHGLAA